MIFQAFRSANRIGVPESGFIHVVAVGLHGDFSGELLNRNPPSGCAGEELSQNTSLVSLGEPIEPVHEHQPGAEAGQGGPDGGIVHPEEDAVRGPEARGLGENRSVEVGEGPALWDGAGGAPG